MSWPRIAALRHDDPAQLRRWIAALQTDSVEISGSLALACLGGRLASSSDGRAVGALRGLLFDDRAQAAQMAERGHKVDAADHGQLAMTVLGQFGPRGLIGMRSQGTMACLHRGQQMAMLARDPVGVGQLYLWRAAGGEVLASDPGLLTGLGAEMEQAHLPGEPLTWAGAATASPALWRVPVGLLAVVATSGIRFERLAWSQSVQPWLRELPPWLARADANAVRQWLRQALRAAGEATTRGLGLANADPATDAWQEALQVMVRPTLAAPSPPDRASPTAARAGAPEPGQTSPGLRWSALGAADLCDAAQWPAAAPEGDVAARRDWLVGARAAAGRGAPQWPAVDLPEPHQRLAVEVAASRWLRHTWTIGMAIAQAQAAAAQAGEMLVWPHLDPAVLATLGALPSDLVRAALLKPETAP